MPENINKTYKWGIVAFVALFSIFLFYLNILNPYMPGDDYMFMMKMPKDGSVGMNRISSVSDFIESQINIYYTCHYRILVHTLIQFFVLLPAWVFDLINTFVFLFIIRLIIPEKGHVLQFPKLYLAVLLFVWIFHPDLANAYFWTTGAFNYSWTLIPLLLFVRKLVDYIDNNKGTRMLFYLSPLVASCNENALISLFAVISLLLVYSYFKRKTFDVYLLLTLIILLIGGFLMIFSPSATARIGRDAMAFQSLGWRVLEFIKRSAFYLLLYSPILFLPLLFKFKNFAIGKSTPWLMLIILLSILSMFAAPIFEIRSSIFGFFLSIYLMLYLLKGSKSIIPIVFVFLIFYGIRFGVERGRDFYKVNQSVKSNIEKLTNNEGKNAVVLDKQCLKIKYKAIVCYEIDDRESYINRSLANYFKVGKVELNNSFSRAYHREKFEETLNKGGLVKFTNIQEDIYIKRSKEGLHLLIDLGEGSFHNEMTTIVRGRRIFNLKHSLIELLPTATQLYFLDFLEYTGDYYEDKNSVLIKTNQGKTFAYHLIYNPELYKHYLISKYSLKNHTHLGDIQKFEVSLSD